MKRTALILSLVWLTQLITVDLLSQHAHKTQSSTSASSVPGWEISRVSLTQGLPQHSIGALAFDQQGFMWIGTEDGLSRYDGFQFEQFKYKPGDSLSLSSNWINDILVDEKDNLWIATNRGLNYLDKKSGQVIRVSNIELPDPIDISTLSIDSSSNLWIGTTQGIFKYITSSGLSEKFLHVPNDPGSLKYDDIDELFIDRENRLWISSEMGLEIRNSKFELLKFFDRSFSKGSFNYSETKIGTVFQDSDGIIWTGNHSGVVAFDVSLNIIKVIQLDSRDEGGIQDITEDAQGHLWVAKKCLYRINPRQPEGVVQFCEDPKNLKSLSQGSTLTELEIDGAGQLWVGAWAGGLTKLREKSSFFHNLIEKPDSNQIPYPPVTGLFAEEPNTLWIGTWGNGLDKWDRLNNTYDTWANSFLEGVNESIISHISKDKSGDLWISSYGGGLTQWNPSKNIVNRFTNQKSSNVGLSSDYIRYSFVDSKNRLWVSTHSNGLNLVDRSTGAIKQFVHDGSQSGSSHANVRQIVEDDQGTLWIGTVGGGLNRYNEGDQSFTHYRFSEDIPNSLSGDIVSEVFVDSKSNLWVGTTTGLNQMRIDDPGKFERYTVEDGLPNDVILAIEEDDFGRLWMSTFNGISCFYPEEKKFINYGLEEGLLDLEYNGTVSAKNFATGELFFGGVRSTTYFQPADFQIDTSHYPLVVSKLSRYNLNDDSDGPNVDLFVNSEELLEFNFNDRIITIEISSMGFELRENIHLQYQLKGFSDQWYDLVNKREVVLTNLDEGNYSLYARAKNRDEVWGQKTLLADLVVRPAWYASSFAKLLYLLLLGLGGFLFYRYQKFRWQLQTNLKLEKAEASRLKELDKQKNALFANISHEFRTPLTVILGMADQLMKNPSNGPRKKLSLIQRNGTQLLGLINQILDITKMESGGVQAKYVYGDVIMYLGYLVESYQSYAISQKRTISIYSIPDELMMDYDPALLHRVIENLISNALKFTDEYGQIKILTKIESNQLIIEVKDNGKGIHSDQLPHIFNRFYQADQSHTRTSEGTGIGLSLVQEIINILKGKITVESTIDIGTNFIISLPIVTKHRSSTISETEVKRLIERGDRLLVSNDDSSEVAEFEAPLVNDERPHLLIIEDNKDVVTYLKTCLKDAYYYHIARNGKQGVDIALESIPDIIITDLMMPQMDGYEVCEQLKSDQRTSHIPIIMLTAKATTTDRLEGLKKGADAYLAKPFNEDELHIRLEKFVQLSRALQNRLAKLELIEDDAQSDFVKSLKDKIYKRLGDDSFQVVHLCSEMAMSRTQLHRKIKALTGYSTAQFIRKIRLQEARHLLETTDLNVSEVAYKVGFKHHTNFTIAFKNEFDFLPTELIHEK